MATRRKQTKMTAQHKTALAEGRNQSRAVRDYLDALEQHRPKRGRKRTPDSIMRQLAQTEAAVPDASGTRRVELLQERRNLRGELESLGAKSDLGHYEKAFVKVARAYGARKGIAYATWREVGVPADVLRRAGISRGS
jgi:hypothetical protein